WSGGTPAAFAPSTFDTRVTASPDSPGTNKAWSEVKPDGAAHGSITGVTPRGALHFSASMPVQVHVKEAQTDPNDCTLNVSLSLSTTKGSIPVSFPKIEGMLPADPNDWSSQSDYDEYYQNPFDMESTPPDHYYMPPKPLAGALAGQT